MEQENTFKLDISDLEIKNSEFAKLLGYKENDLPVQVNAGLHEILSEAGKHLEIRGGYVIKDILKLDPDEGEIKLNEFSFVPGRTICNSLEGSEKLICFLCTAGEGINRWAAEIMEVDPLKFYMIDILGSLVVDHTAGNFHTVIEKKLASEGLCVTNSYSPGYCGWKLAEQKKLFSLFPSGFCKISLSDSSLMTPMKSISGIIGIGKKAEKKAYSCEICDLPGCSYRDLNR